ELGAKWDLAEGNLSLRTALFRTEKFNERNTDVDQAADAYLLNGKRHTDGIEFEAAGRPAPGIEVFGGVAYMRGRIDEAGSSEASQRMVGRESGLTPRWTGSVWATWQFAPKWRAGLGADGMSSRVPAQAESGDSITGIVNRAPGYVKADALLEYDAGSWRTRLNLINLFDKVYADGIYRGFTVAGPGRGAQLTVSALF
ncbi:MAG TPA: TonB-dependent receptor, partial [Methylibium sp.]|nr:TonB-dependent receptor [Methylibium sp.]